MLHRQIIVILCGIEQMDLTHSELTIAELLIYQNHAQWVSRGNGVFLTYKE